MTDTFFWLGHFPEVKWVECPCQMPKNRAIRFIHSSPFARTTTHSNNCSVSHCATITQHTTHNTGGLVDFRPCQHRGPKVDWNVIWRRRSATYAGRTTTSCRVHKQHEARTSRGSYWDYPRSYQPFGRRWHWFGGWRLGCCNATETATRRFKGELNIMLCSILNYASRPASLVISYMSSHTYQVFKCPKIDPTEDT